MSRPRIVAHTIVGSTNEQYLQFALDNVANFVDIFVVNDNGRNPLNKERIFNSVPGMENRVIYFESDFEGFDHARNLCFERTPEFQYDWMFKLDADEVFYPDRFEKVIEFLKTTPANVVKLYFWHLLSWRVYQELHPVALLYRWDANMRWSGKVHEVLRRSGDVVELWESVSHVHYSYTISQREIYQKWQLYSDLENDPEHYRSRGVDPDRLIEDRYNLSGAPWFHEHPPGAKEYIAAEMKIRGFHDVPLPVAVCVHGRDPDALIRTVASTQGSSNPDYPYLFFLIPEESAVSDWQYLRERIAIPGDLLPSVSNNYEIEAVHQRVLTHAQQRPDVGHFLFVKAGTTFPAQGWCKCLVNACYCLYSCYDCYAPQGAQSTLLVPRDMLGWSPSLLRKYESPYCLVDEGN